jgi:hypothetical protein
MHLRKVDGRRRVPRLHRRSKRFGDREVSLRATHAHFKFEPALQLLFVDARAVELLEQNNHIAEHDVPFRQTADQFLLCLCVRLRAHRG